MSIETITLLIDNPRVFLGEFIAFPIGGVVLAYSFVWLVMQNNGVSKIKTSYLWHFVGLLLVIISSAIIRIILMITFMGKNAYEPSTPTTAAFLFLILPAVIAALYILWLKRKSGVSGFEFKKSNFKLIAFSAATLILLIIAYNWIGYEKNITLAKSQSWSTDQMKTDFVGLSIQTTDDKVFTDFEFSAENLTEQDYKFPTSIDAFLRLPNGTLYQSTDLMPPIGAYLPAKHKVIVKFTMTFKHNLELNAQNSMNNSEVTNFVSDKLKDIDGFVILDRENHKELTFLNPLRNLKKPQ